MLTGEIITGRYTRLAVERHYRDLLDGHKRGLLFSPEHARFAIDFFPTFLRHTKGAAAGRPFELEPAQLFWRAVVYGWLHAESRRRRFRTWYREVARKNGKSTELAGDGLFLLFADGEPGAEVYCAATKLDQAKITFATAEAMVGGSPALRRLIDSHKHRLFIRGTQNEFRPLGADASTLDGLNPHANIVDEVHAHKTRHLWDILDTARGAREQSLMLAITTAGYVLDGVCVELRNYLIAILEGRVKDDEFGGAIYSLDEGDDPFDERVWIKANPNLHAVPGLLDDMRRSARQARQLPGVRIAYLTKRCNIWCGAGAGWLDVRQWDRCKEKSSPLLEGRRVYAGLDLASTEDLNARVFVYPPSAPGEMWHVRLRCWVPEAKLDAEDIDGAPYRRWAAEGWLETTSGNVTDHDVVAEAVIADASRCELIELGADPWNLGSVETRLQAAGVVVVRIPQTMQMLGPATKQLERLVLSKRLAHDGNPILRWALGNVSLMFDSNDNYRPDKKRSRGRIDPVVALVMALNRAFSQIEDAPPGIDFF